MANKRDRSSSHSELVRRNGSCCNRKFLESGMNQQRYILSCVLGKKVVNTDGIIAIMPELRRQGVNLNQIAQRLNERGYIDYKKNCQQC